MGWLVVVEYATGHTKWPLDQPSNDGVVACVAVMFCVVCRLLKPGGCMSIGEMDPNSPAFQRIFSNAFAFAAFKSTEPWLMDYVTLDLHAAMMQVGFGLF